MYDEDYEGNVNLKAIFNKDIEKSADFIRNNSMDNLIKNAK